MASLRDKTSSKLIKKALESLPKGSQALDLAYYGAMQRIEDQMEGFRSVAKKLLGWLSYSERLMTVMEVRHALAIEPETPELDKDNLCDVDEIVGFCAGLVIVDEETQLIRLVHYTTQEFFRRNGDKVLPCAKQDIAISCLTYLLYESFGEGWVFPEEIRETAVRDEAQNRLVIAVGEEGEGEGEGEDNVPRRISRPINTAVRTRVTRYPFLDYAARHWATHTRVCEQQNIKKLTMRLLNDARKNSSASQVMLDLDDIHRIHEPSEKIESRSPLSAMHVLAYLGWEEMISELLSHGLDANAEDIVQRTPLWWAALAGHEAVVKLLLSQGQIKVNDRASTANGHRGELFSGAPLSIAASRGRHKIVELLIEREDMDVNMPDSIDMSPLSSATLGGHSAVVEMLLTRRDIDVNAEGKIGGSPLFNAILSHHEGIVKQLVKQHNVQVNLASGAGTTPLAWAARLGRLGVVQILLACPGIDVNARNNQRYTPLIEAARCDHEAVVELLLSHSEVEVNFKDIFGNTALHYAAYPGFAPILKLLISRTDVDVNLMGNRGKTPLHEAAMRCNTSAVEVLLGCLHIDVNAKDDNGRTPLHVAVRAIDCDHLEDPERERGTTLTTLLGHVDIEVNPKDHRGQTPLAHAILLGYTEVLKILCAHPDVDLDPKDDEGQDVPSLLKSQRRFAESGYDDADSENSVLAVAGLADEDSDWSSTPSREERDTLPSNQEKCLRILRTARETRARNGPRTSETVAA